MGPSTIQHDRNITAQKVSQAWDADRSRTGTSAGAGVIGAGIRDMVDLEGQAQWDADDVMLFLWGNSVASKERHQKKMEERT